MTREDELESAVHDALQAYLREKGTLSDDDVLVGWLIGWHAEMAQESGAARYGHAQPAGQRFHVSHGLAAGLMAAFNSSVGAVASEDGEEGY